MISIVPPTNTLTKISITITPATSLQILSNIFSSQSASLSGTAPTFGTVSLADLPTETTLEITSCFSQIDYQALRLIFRHLDVLFNQFFFALPAPLPTLNLGFRLYEDFSNGPWNDLFSSLQETLHGLDHLEISFGQYEYHVSGHDKIDQMLQWLAVHVQEDWEEDSEDGDDWFELWFNEVIDRSYKLRRSMDSPKLRRNIKCW